MTLTEIVAKIIEKYAAAAGRTPTSLIGTADILQKRIYRQLKKENFTSYDLITDQPTYPITMKTTDVFQVDVSSGTDNKFCSYPLRKASDIINSCSKYHYFISDPTIGDWIGIHPLPTDSNTTLVIYHYESPITLNPNALSSVPLMDENYHMMLVYGVCKEIAEDYRDSDSADGFAIQYNALENELLGIVKKTDRPTVLNKMGW